MPDPVDLDLGELTRQRQQLADVAVEQTGVRVELANRTAELDGLRRTATDTAALTDVERAIAALEEQRTSLHERRGELLGGIADLATGLLADHDISDSVRTLDASIPDRDAPGAYRDAVLARPDRPRHPHLPRPGPPRCPRAGAHR